MRYVLAMALVLTLQAPALAQDPGGDDCNPLSPGCDRLNQLWREFEREMEPRLRGLPDELGRRFDELRRDLDPWIDDLTGRLDPWWRDLRVLLGDLTGWHAPEVLPNGDILIRRRPAPQVEPPPAGPVPEDQPPADAEPGDGPVTEPLEL